MPAQEVEVVPGRILIKARASVDLVGGFGTLVAHSSQMAALNSEAKAFEARPVFPQYSREALLELENRASRGLAAPSLELRSKMSELGSWVEVTVDPAMDPVELAKRYAALEEIEQAEPDYLFRLVEGRAGEDEYEAGRGSAYALPVVRAPQWVPNDPDLGLQWGLDFIDAPEAWFLERGSPSQVIAIIDTGVDLDHPDLASKIWTNADELLGDGNGDNCPGVCGIDEDGDGLIDEDGEGRQPADPGYDPAFADDDDENGYIDDFNGWDWISNGEGYEDNDPQDDNGHGTHCAGIAAAATDNGVGGAGACPECTIMPLKAFQSSGTGAFSDIAKAVEYAWRNGAAVISMSFSSPADSLLLSDALSLAFSRASLVAAAGNSAMSADLPKCPGFWTTVGPFYPAHYSFVLGVEARIPDGRRPPFSNCKYEIGNPGTAIYSTVLDNDYTSWSGTSMAAPFAAGTAGLLRSLHAGDPSWGPDLVFGQLIQSAGNAFEALTLTPLPDLRLISFEIVDDACGTCDSDGVADAGETVELAVTIRNLWGAATEVAGALSTTDALATVVDGAADWGAMGPATFDDNADDPFVVDLDPATGNNRSIVFDLVVDAANGGTGINEQLTITVQRGLEKTGTITSNETWTPNNLYIVTGNLLIDTGASLVIEPGTRIQLDPAASILVRGELVARGTAEDRIVFAGNPYGWGLIRFTGDSVPATYDASGNYLSGSAIEYCLLSDSAESKVLETASTYVAKNIFLDNFNGVSLGEGSRLEANLFLNNNEGGPSIASHSTTGTIRHNTVFGKGGGSAVSLSATAQGQVLIGDNNLYHTTPGSYRLDISGPLDADVSGNYWLTTNQQEIADSIFDFFDNANAGVAFFEPFLVAPDTLAPPILSEISLSPAPPVGVERVNFVVSFSKPMDTSILPEVFFGPALPFTSHPVDLNRGWLDPQTFQVETDITVFTGDGSQTITVWNAEDLEGFPAPSGDHRFTFEIVTSGTSAAQLSAAGDIGHVDLSWFASTLPDAAGYNLYRAETSGGPYTKLNSAIIVDTAYADNTALPGVHYFYIYRVVTTDLLEGPDSDEASGTALDTVPPEINHSPVSQAPAGQPLTLLATITDNIAVTGASAFHRPLGGGGGYVELPMVNAVGDQYTVNIPSADMVPPGVEYYLETTDGVSFTQHGTPASAHQVTVQDVPVILSVDPDTGSFSGGDVVTITGSNFVDPPLVRFGGTASPTVTFVSGTELTAETPAHYPALVDVEVENPSTALGRLTNAFTFTGNTATLTLPAAATGDRLTNVQLAVNTPSVEGLISADLSITFDSTVLTAVGAAAGNLTAGFSIATNTTTPGTVTVSMANSTPVTGAGDLLVIDLQVIGAPDDTTVLTFSSVSLNSGAIPTTPVNGGLTVNNAFDLSGLVSYYQGAAPVASTQLDVTGSGSYSTATDTGGIYGFAELPSGNYTLTPAKTDGYSPSIVSPLDASLVLQHSSGSISLAGNQAAAADVNKAGGIDAFDASLILQYAAGLIVLPFPGNPQVWEFVPSLYSYTGLDEHQTNQDFTAILSGDVSGNWTAPPPPGAPVSQSASPILRAPAATLRFDDQAADPRETIQVPLVIDDADGVLAALATVTWEPTVLTIQSVATTTFTSAFSLATNLSVAGEATVAMASATSLAGSGNLLLLTFEVIGSPDDTSALDVVSAELNEGAIPANPTDGLFTVNNAFDLSGTVSYYQSAGPVPGTQLDVTGSGSYSGATDGTGAYDLIGLPTGDYTLTPSKSDAYSPSIISPLDASFVLQHSAGLITLAGGQATAADVNKAEGISPLDASLILQYAAGLIGLPFPNNPGVWEFAPSLYSYTGLDEHQANQDFTGILSGDVSGNWSAPPPPGTPVSRSASPIQRAPAATLRFPEQWGDTGATVTIPLAIEDSDALIAALATVSWQPDVLAVRSISTTGYSSSFSIATNLSVPGQATVAMASATPPASSAGDLLLLTFDVIGIPGDTSPLDLVSVGLNEGAIPAVLVDSQLNVVHPEELTVADATLAGPGVYQACETTFVGPDVSIANGADVTFRAGSTVIFLDGVAVATSAKVTVENAPLTHCR